MGTYIDQTDVENRFGATNVARWSQGSPDSVEADTTRIAAAITWAEGEINDAMRGGAYAVPLTATASGGLTKVEDWAATLAGCWLARMRGESSAKKGGDGDRYAALEREVRASIASVQSGAVRLACSRSTTRGGNAPTVI